jgi:hypothetical protein
LVQVQIPDIDQIIHTIDVEKRRLKKLKDFEKSKKYYMKILK